MTILRLAERRVAVELEWWTPEGPPAKLETAGRGRTFPSRHGLFALVQRAPALVEAETCQGRWLRQRGTLMSTPIKKLALGISHRSLSFTSTFQRVSAASASKRSEATTEPTL